MHMKRKVSSLLCFCCWKTSAASCGQPAMPAVVSPARFRSLISAVELVANVSFGGGGILLAICARPGSLIRPVGFPDASRSIHGWFMPARSEEHTSELQSHLNLVCRLLLEKKKPNLPFAVPGLLSPTSPIAST